MPTKTPKKPAEAVNELERLKAENEFLRAEVTRLEIPIDKRLVQSELNYRMLIERMHEGVLYVDNDDRILFANSRFCEILGYALSEIKGKKAYELLLGGDKNLPEVKKVMAERAKGVSSRYEMPVRHKDGSFRYFEISGSPVIDIDGKVIGSMGIHIDITERLTANREILHSETRYRTLVERMNEGLVIVDRGGLITFANDYLCNLLGYEQRELVGILFTRAFNLDKGTIKDLISRFGHRLQGETDVYEICFASKHGTEIWFRVSASPLFGEDGEMIGSMGLYTDITEQRKAQEEAARLMAVVNSTIDLVGMTDYSGKTLYVNNALRKALGIDKDVAPEKISWEKFYTKESLEKVSTEVIPYIMEHGIWKGELCLKAKKGKDIPVSQVLICHKDAKGYVDFFATISRDITEAKKAEREIAILARMPDETPSPIMRIDNEGVIVYANNASALLLKNWKTEQGKKLPNIWIKIVTRLLASGNYKEYEVDCGKTIFDLKVIPVSEYGYVNIIGSDITHKKKAEKLLIASEKKYRGVVEDQTELISRFLGDGTLTFANNAYCRYFGMKQGDVIGKKIFTNMPPASKKKFLERLALLTKENPVISYNQEIRKNGVPIKWQMWTDRAIYDDAGLFIEYQSVGRDVTELKEAEKEIKYKETFLRQIIDTIPSLIYVKDLEGQYLMGNKSFANFFGKKVNNIYGLTDKEMFSRDVASDYMRDDQEVMRHGTMQVIGEEKVHNKTEGRDYWFQTIKAPLTVPGNDEKQILGVSIDITERKEFENALRFQLEFKELISSISTYFINISYKEIDQAINDALAMIGKFIGSDRIVIMFRDGKEFKYKYSWFSDSGLPKKGFESVIKVDDFKWETEQIRKYGALYYPDTIDIPTKAGVIGKRSKEIGIKSLLLLPLQTRNIMFGYLTISSIKEHAYWSNDSVTLMKIASQIFSGALERKATEELLNFRVEFENIITSISANFINIPPENINQEINASLKFIANFLDIELGFVYLSGKDHKQFNLSHSWFSDKEKNVKNAAKKISLKDFTWVYRQLRMHGVANISLSDHALEDNKSLRRHMEVLNIKSMVAVPLMYHGVFTGTLAFASRHKENFWPEEAMPLLKIFGQVVANALERKATEENLTETKELYRTLASNIPKSAVLLFDRDLRYRLVEGAALEEQGYSKTHIEGRTIYDVLPASRRKILEPLYKDALDGKESIFEREFNKKHYLIHVMPVKNEQDEIYAGMLMSLDISDLKEIQRKLEEQTIDLKRSNEDLELFAYAASHDLQEPLRMISSYVNLIERRIGDQLTGDVKEFMHYAIDGVKRMQQLINDLLEYSRVDRKGHPFAEIETAKILELVKINLKTVMEEKHAKVIYKSLPNIVADQPQIISLFQNMVENAIKFHGAEPPVIEVSGREFKSKYRFTVKDNGIGIDPKYFDRIFVIFQRLNSRKEYAGTGIGLAICKKIVERHGGRIWLQSEYGKGTTFNFEIAKGTMRNGTT